MWSQMVFKKKNINKDFTPENIKTQNNSIPEITETIINEAEKSISKKPKKKIANDIDKIIKNKENALIRYEQKI